VPPGRIIERELEARGWSQKDLAAITGRPPQVINEIVQGRKRITPETAHQLAEAFGTSPEFWANMEAKYRLLLASEDYDDTAGNIGNQQGDTFWSAARTIVEQLYMVLRPGAHAVFVLKAFVRNGQIVDFPGQWQALCESVGFVTLHEHHAMLTEERGTQIGLDGERHTKKVERKSFFRRLAESKGSPRIDYETVICTVKAEEATWIENR
jgi:HTH-type transcriptional regulator/antitoxin HigA